MPKMKTHRGAAKRFSVTASGKVKRSKAFASHILTKKTTKTKRTLRKATLVHSANEKAVKRLIPYLLSIDADIEENDRKWHGLKEASLPARKEEKS